MPGARFWASAVPAMAKLVATEARRMDFMRGLGWCLVEGLAGRWEDGAASGSAAEREARSCAARFHDSVTLTCAVIAAMAWEKSAPSPVRVSAWTEKAVARRAMSARERF